MNIKQRLSKLEKLTDEHITPKHFMTVKCIDGDNKIIRQYSILADKNSEILIYFGNGFIPPNLGNSEAKTGGIPTELV